MTPTVQALRKQLKQLRARHDAGAIKEAQYNTERAALERQLLDYLVDAPETAAPAAGSAGAAPAKRRAGVQTWALLGVFIVVVAAAGYSFTGSADKSGQVFAGMGEGSAAVDADGNPAPHEMGSEQMAALVAKLAERMQANPDDAEGWMMLGRSYAAMGRNEEALASLAKAAKLQPTNADVLADFADALAVKNGRSLEGEPLQVLERALKANPAHLKALVLVGTAAFNRGDYPQAVQVWDRAAKAGPAESPLVQMASSGAAEARTRANMPAAAPGAAAAMAAAGPVAQAAALPAPPAATGGTGTVSGTVTIAPEMLAKASPDDAVFIYARAAVGSRMPLALLRKQVKDLPASFTLDDSMAMSPAAKLSGAEKVVVGARVTKTGQAMPSPGDLEGLSEPVAPGGTGIKVQISSMIK